MMEISCDLGELVRIGGMLLRDPQFLPLEKLKSPWFLNFCLSFLAAVAAKRAEP